MWSNRDWIGDLYPQGADSHNFLRHYSSVFNTVEGNTTFYALPSEATVSSWREQAQPGFKFCFKLPKSITHQGGLKASPALTEFFKRLSPLSDFLGPFMIQLPAELGADSLPTIERFIGQLPSDFEYSLELRNTDFFKKDAVEKRLNQRLMAAEVNRVCFDSRALFSQVPTSDSDREAQRKKPDLPVHAIATGQSPIVRFIGTKDKDYNTPYYQAWLAKLGQWCEEGRSPYFFLHTPSNKQAPFHAQFFHDQLQAIQGWQPLAKTLKHKEQLSIF